MQTLTEYINEHYDGNQAKFAEYLTNKTDIKVWPQMVTTWINKEFIVVNGDLYSFRREL
tara:strand:+ start:18634 stop:18810 length:177 start_codon:yes stop_codon:yes gene_type:complete